LNYGSSLIGVGAASVFRDKPGHVIRVEMDTLDHLIAAFMLRKPDLVKLDVEGAEAAAVAGMMDTLTDIRPTLMIELHGRAAAAATLTQLARLQYQWSVPATGTRWSTAEALLDSLPEACVQIIGSPP